MCSGHSFIMICFIVVTVLFVTLNMSDIVEIVLKHGQLGLVFPLLKFLSSNYVLTHISPKCTA